MSAPEVELPAPPRRERRVLPVVALLVVVLAMTAGGYAVAAALEEPAGPAVEVAGVLRISPPSGWQVAERFEGLPGVRLTRGSGNLDARAAPYGGPARGLLDLYVEQWLRPEARQLSLSSPQSVTLASGLGGVRIRYVGTFGDVQGPIEGEVTSVVSSSGIGVVFDGWAPSGLLEYVLEDVNRMIAEAQIR